ncbi:UBX domain-containing protein 1 [Hypsizygus marmoreus]|uniref:UBX domain-containing protein 1 n=1 Tax=Hypsizygus marmoreus TaxID=39966 RepID=A0A369JR44_HYPMA|nr:UBX domain-containing protein 1 [Hypsizygus marmoreus]
MSSDDNTNPPASSGGRSLGGGAPEPLPESWSHPAPAARVGRIGDWSNGGRGGGSGSGGRFGTIGSLGGASPGSGRQSQGRSDDDSDEEDENKGGETWFAGGERSGINIQNPDRPSRIPGGDAVRELLRRAAEAGPPREVETTPRGAFSGSGHKLGSDEVDSELVPDPNAPKPDEEAVAIRYVALWRNGFTIEDGELMRYDDPHNAEILAQINSGRPPLSVLNIRPGQEVELRVAKRLEQDYVPPQGARVFAGTGHRLGAPVPSFAPGSSSGSGTGSAMPGGFPTTAAPSGADVPPPQESITTMFEVDQTLPTTSVQIRLADGTRMVCRMNLTHKVQDLRNFINASRPENLSRPYTIGTTFPNRTLEDPNATIESAGLVNSVIVQRWV